MTDLVLPGITLVIGLPIALWLTSRRRLERRIVLRFRRAGMETVALMWPVLQGHPARLLPGPAATAPVVVRASGRGNGRTCTADATAARAERAPASVVPSQLDPSSPAQLAVVGAGAADPVNAEHRGLAPTTLKPAGGVVAATAARPATLTAIAQLDAS